MNALNIPKWKPSDYLNIRKSQSQFSNTCANENLIKYSNQTVATII